jgi:hypothetical protein
MAEKIGIDMARYDAAIKTAGYAVAAVAQGQGIESISLERKDGFWTGNCKRTEGVSSEACIIFLLAGPMVAYALGPKRYETCSAYHVGREDCWEALEAIDDWDDCPLRVCKFTYDETFAYESECLFELYKVRTMIFLKQPERLRAVKALAAALMNRERISAQVATEFVEKFLRSEA